MRAENGLGNFRILKRNKKIKINGVKMKKYKCFFIFIILIALFCNFLNAEDLPKNAFNFMGSVFPDFKIDNISLENNIYKVTLLNEAVISFDRQGDWVKIDSSFEPIPQTVFPKKVLDSIIEKFKNPKIVYANKYDKIYEKLLYEVIIYDKYDIFAIYIKEDGEMIDMHFLKSM